MSAKSSLKKYAFKQRWAEFMKETAEEEFGSKKNVMNTEVDVFVFIQVVFTI